MLSKDVSSTMDGILAVGNGSIQISLNVNHPAFLSKEQFEKQNETNGDSEPALMPYILKLGNKMGRETIGDAATAQEGLVKWTDKINSHLTQGKRQQTLPVPQRGRGKGFTIIGMSGCFYGATAAWDTVDPKVLNQDGELTDDKKRRRPGIVWPKETVFDKKKGKCGVHARLSNGYAVGRVLRARARACALR